MVPMQALSQLLTELREVVETSWNKHGDTIAILMNFCGVKYTADILCCENFYGFLFEENRTKIYQKWVNALFYNFTLIKKIVRGLLSP
jgi:hypothetical protein